MLWAVGKDGVAVEVGPDRGPVTVISPEQLCKSAWLAAVHVEDLSRAAHAILHSLRTGDPIDIEHQMRVDSADWRWFRSRGQAQRDPTGQVVGWHGISEDIHEYKILSQSLQQCEERLGEFEL
jgi:PAS domain-containing protein